MQVARRGRRGVHSRAQIRPRRLAPRSVWRVGERQVFFNHSEFLALKEFRVSSWAAPSREAVGDLLKKYEATKGKMVRPRSGSWRCVESDE